MSQGKCTFFPVEQRILDEFQAAYTAAINEIQFCVNALKTSIDQLANKLDDYPERKGQEDALKAAIEREKDLDTQLSLQMELH
jgi:hypothetical protein